MMNESRGRLLVGRIANKSVERLVGSVVYSAVDFVGVLQWQILGRCAPVYMHRAAWDLGLE